MIIFPAIDLFGGKAVRLFKGDYSKMTVYSDNPVSVALDFKKKGATAVHLVDLEAAKDGIVHNFDIIKKIKEETGLFCEIGGGIRDELVAKTYLDAGLDRIIIGTKAVTDPDFVKNLSLQYPGKIAVGADFKDGCVAIKGWTEKTELKAVDFCKNMQDLGIKTLICTDISKDGVNKGTNIELYKELSEALSIDIIASGGVSNIDNIKTLAEMKLYGAIVGRAYYDGLIELSEAIEVAK